jgi:hypothetical protein
MCTLAEHQAMRRARTEASESFIVVIDNDAKQGAKIELRLSMKKLEINETAHLHDHTDSA